MKKQLLASLLFLMFIAFFACQEQTEDSNKISFNQTTGDQITKGEAERWINRFSSIQASTRVQGSGQGYNINEEQLSALLQTDNLVGIAFHHATDDDGTHHVLAIPLDETLALWNGDKHIVDANTNEKVSVATSKSWSANYIKNHPNEILYHRFGRDIFSDITSLAYFTGFEIRPALNDELEPQLVLVVKDKGSINGRTQGDESYYDKSNPGPRCCD